MILLVCTAAKPGTADARGFVLYIEQLLVGEHQQVWESHHSTQLRGGEANLSEVTGEGTPDLGRIV